MYRANSNANHSAPERAVRLRLGECASSAELNP